MVRALAASFCLFALTAVPAVSGAAAGRQLTNSEQRTLSVAQESIQLAQRGRCKAFGQTNNCKPIWDRRGKSCVCAGA